MPRNDYNSIWLKYVYENDKYFDIDKAVRGKDEHGDTIIKYVYMDEQGNLVENSLAKSGYEDILFDYIIPLIQGKHVDIDYDDEKLKEAFFYYGFDNYCELLYGKYLKKIHKSWKECEKIFLECWKNQRPWYNDKASLAEELSMNFLLPVKFIDKYPECINWNFLCLNPAIPEWYFEKHLEEINWNKLNKNPNISYNFFRQYDPKFPRSKYLCKNVGSASAVYINEVGEDSTELDWKSLSGNTGLDSSFFYRNKKRLYKKIACGNYQVPLEIIGEWLNEDRKSVKMSLLGANIGITIDFIKEHNLTINNDFIGGLFSNSNIPFEYLENFLPLRLRNLRIPGIDNSIALKNPSLTVENIKRLLKKINNASFVANPSLNYPFLLEHKQDKCNPYIFSNPFLFINESFDRDIQKKNLKWVVFHYNKTFTYYNNEGCYNPNMDFTNMEKSKTISLEPIISSSSSSYIPKPLDDDEEDIGSSNRISSSSSASSYKPIYVNEKAERLFRWGN